MVRRAPARGQDAHTRRRESRDECAGAPGADRGSHSQLRESGWSRERERRHGLWPGRPDPSAASLGQVASAQTRSGPGKQAAMEIAGIPEIAEVDDVTASSLLARARELIEPLRSR